MVGQRAAADEAVWAIPYDYVGACDGAPAVCLGTPWFNWGPAYLEHRAERHRRHLRGHLPVERPGLVGHEQPRDDGRRLRQWPRRDAGEPGRSSTSSSPGWPTARSTSWTGPLNNQDGSVWLAEGETATPQQVWYTKQLLEGIDGASEPPAQS